MALDENVPKNISRIDSPEKRTHGWLVRVQFNKQRRAKLFSDSRYGGREEALEEAIQWRNQVEREMGKPRTERFVVGTHPNNETGVLGVRRIRKHTGAYDDEGNPRTSEVYEVHWSPEPGVLKRTSVSIRKYGEEEAFRRACRLRRQKEREIFGSRIQTPPQ